jgi:hypothetical protein
MCLCPRDFKPQAQILRDMLGFRPRAERPVVVERKATHVFVAHKVWESRPGAIALSPWRSAAPFGLD